MGAGTYPVVKSSVNSSHFLKKKRKKKSFFSEDLKVQTLKEERVKRGDERNFRIPINVSVFSLKGYLGTHNYLSRSETQAKSRLWAWSLAHVKCFQKASDLGLSN